MTPSPHSPLSPKGARGEWDFLPSPPWGRGRPDASGRVTGVPAIVKRKAGQVANLGVLLQNNHPLLKGGRNGRLPHALGVRADGPNGGLLPGAGIKE